MPFHKFLVLIAIFFIQITATNVFAAVQNMDGKYFLKTCTATPPSPTLSKATIEGVHCVGYIRGFISALQFEQHSRVIPNMAMVCLPNITYGQARDVFIKYLRAHPDTLDQDGGSLFFVALHEAYPCNR